MEKEEKEEEDKNAVITWWYNVSLPLWIFILNLLKRLFYNVLDAEEKTTWVAKSKFMNAQPVTITILILPCWQ